MLLKTKLTKLSFKFFLSFYFDFIVNFKEIQKHCYKLHLLNIIFLKKKNLLGKRSKGLDDPDAVE
jgi:hypothetical protein